jgi:glucose-1-phosphate thymidylyltransferase
MAGRGSRLRPHTLTTPKPLINVAGMPIVHRLVKDIAKVLPDDVTEVAYVLGDKAYFGDDVVESLSSLSKSLGAKTSIYRQNNPLGTGHAVMCAAPSLSGPAVIAYADTLIRADLSLDPSADSVIWVKKVKNPDQYGVVKLDSSGSICDLIEKPKEYVSDLAVIGVYYFKDVEKLRNALQSVLDDELTSNGEYQINDGILRMIEDNRQFLPGKVNEWMDCGNPKHTIDTNGKMLGFLKKEGEKLVGNFKNINSTIIPPCYIANGVSLINCVIGPNVSIGPNTSIENSKIENTIIQSDCKIIDASLDKSMIGNHVHYNGKFKRLSIGDYSVLE